MPVHRTILILLCIQTYITMTSNHDNTVPQNAPEGTYGPHSSRLANAADPRVDSDRDNRGASVQTASIIGTHNAAAPAHNEATYGTQTNHLANQADVDLARGRRPATGGAHGGNAAAAAAAEAAHENTGERVARGIKGAFAQGHGIGESLRGNINSAIDSLTGDKVKLAHDQEVARGGFREVQNKQFEKAGTDKAL
ncbi:hypothetical protein B0T22DRAFT_460154 [Podospora appendiculata]|uniref:Uncharacterized protein n=1 Tax=Podospora appendiculata TaxID=314037 RepID=A0AAE0XAA5_9PEZI|nr:hypothetical protein B0T22DRAFT_460154 [Podospora appendiculata]